MWSRMEYIDDSCREMQRSLSGVELARLEHLAEHPELTDSILNSLPETDDTSGWGQ